MTPTSHNRDNTVDFDQETAMTPPLQREVFSPDESEQTRWNKLLTRGIGNYSLKGVLGRGTFGTVYRAHDDALDRDVAIKVLNNPLDNAGMDLFRQEARVIAALAKHPCIVQIYQWGDCDGCPYFVLEYIESNASDLMRQHLKGVPVEIALRIAKSAAEALGFAHSEGILHRDIKPANILLEDEGRTVKLADFGLAQLQKLGDGSDKGVIAGSPPYMSPEQIECRPLDGRADIFSLGVSLYQLLSGKLPFAGRTASELFQNIRNNLYTPIEQEMPGLAPELCAIIGKATAHNPDERFPDGETFAAALGEIMDGGKEETIAVSAAAPIEKRKRWPLTLAAGLVAIAALAAAIFLPLGGETENQVLAQARQELDKGDLEAAQNLYQTVLTENPVDGDALYGQGFVKLLQGAPEEAKALFENIPNAPDLKLEGMAAVAAETAPEKALPAIEEAKSTGQYAYSDVLLARIAMLEQKNDAVVEQLSKLGSKDFYFTWQYCEALRLLGQAYYSQKAFDKAQEVFGQLQQLSGQKQQQLADAYLQMIRQQTEASKNEAVRESVQRISKLLREGGVKPAEDTWTSRPLTLLIMPVEQPVTPFALESGLGDLLPGFLGDEILAKKYMDVVDREELQTILQEQEISTLLGSNEKDRQTRLGNVFGARLLLKAKFARYGGKDQIVLSAIDTETSTRKPIKLLTVDGDITQVDGIVATLASMVNTTAEKAYPLQARLYQKDGAAYINIGAQTGLKTSTVFDVYSDPEMPPRENVAVTVTDGIGPESARVQVDGLTVSELPQDAASGLYVKQRDADE